MSGPKTARALLHTMGVGASEANIDSVNRYVSVRLDKAAERAHEWGCNNVPDFNLLRADSLRAAIMGSSQGILNNSPDDHRVDTNKTANTNDRVMIKSGNPKNKQINKEALFAILSFYLVVGFVILLFYGLNIKF